MVKPIEDLEKILEIGLENNINLLLNIPPDKTGQIPDKWIEPHIKLKHRMKHVLQAPGNVQ